MDNTTVIGYFIHEAVTKSPYEIIKKKDKYVVIRAILQDYKLNRNLRLYEYDVISEGLKDPRVAEMIAKRSWYGESGHPLEQTLERQTTIVKTNSSHIILGFDIYNDRVEGTIVNSPYEPGKAFRDEIVDLGVETAFSMRGIGNVVKEQGFVRVTKPLKIITYDNVLYPSHNIAYQQSVMTESVKQQQVVSESGILYPVYDFMLKNSILKESENLNMIAEAFGKNISELDIKLSEDYNTATVQMDASTRMKVMLESNITKDNKYRKFLKDMMHL